MAALVSRKFGSLQSLNTFLRGVLESGPIDAGAPVSSPTVVYGLHNRTLVFTTPATTVTFSDASGGGLSIKDIVGQIATALGGSYTVRTIERRIQIETNGGGSIVLASGTAAPYLGLGTAVTTTKYNAPDGAVPRLVLLSSMGIGETVVAVTEE